MEWGRRRVGMDLDTVNEVVRGRGLAKTLFEGELD